MNTKIVYVNITKIINKSKIGKLEIERNQVVREVLVQAEQAAEKMYSTMSDEAMQKNRAIDVANINNSWLGEQQHTRMVSLNAIKCEVEAYRKMKKLDVILNSDFVVAAEQIYDVTEDIIGLVNNIDIDYGNIPTFTVRATNLVTEKKEE